jgi:Mg-chelatase subunit ChlD
MKYLTRTILPFALLLACANSVGQSCPPHYVIVSAFDQAGRPVTDLGASNFRASRRKHTLDVLSASFRRDPSFRVVLVLDAGGSMAGRHRGEDKWEIARTAALEFLSAAPPQAQISLITFAGTTDYQFDSSGGRKPIEDWLNGEETLESKAFKGKTSLYSTLLDTVKSLEPAHPGDAIYVVSDGYDKGDADRSAVAAELRSSGVRLFTFLLNDATVIPLGVTPPTELHEMARASGGLAFRLKEETAGSGWAGSGFVPHYSYQKMAGFARNASHWVEGAIIDFYVLSIQEHDGSSGAGEWKLEVVDSQGRERKDVVLAYPAAIRGCHGSASN